MEGARWATNLCLGQEPREPLKCVTYHVIACQGRAPHHHSHSPDRDVTRPLEAFQQIDGGM